jgi:hypothetical protein
MIATMSQQAPTLSLPTSHPSASKKPRLSLQIKSSAVATVKPGAALKADIDPTSTTAFNTLSNAYAAAIELCSPKVATPPPAFDSKSPASNVRKSGLRLVTNAEPSKTPIFPSQHTQTPGPFNITYPDTPTAAFSAISPSTAYPRANIPSFTFTPPQSAHPSDESTQRMFSFTHSRHVDAGASMSPRTPRRRATTGNQHITAPYTHPRSLHSILRNSPLPPRSALAPMSPTRASRRLADRVGKKLCFNNPLTQTITTERYIKSHIDLLAEEASPHSATDSEAEGIETLDLAMAYTGDETRDGGQTPGPFEEMRRRMAGLGADSDSETPGTKKRKRKEKKRRWVWTIGVNEDENEDQEPSPVNSSRSQSPENQSQVQNTATNCQAEDSEQASAIKIQIPFEASNKDPVSAAPVTAIECPSEASDKAPMTTIDLQTDSVKTPMTAIKRWPEVPDYNMVAMEVEELPEPLAPAITIDSSGDTDMIDRPSTSHSI